MNAFTKTALATSMALGLALPGIATAGDQDAPIVVQSQAAMAEWQAEVNADLSRNMMRVGRTPNHTPRGVVQVAFTLDADGSPTDFVTYSSSGDRRTDRAARLALSRLDNLDAAPVSNVGNARFIANMIFANSPADHKTLTAQLDKREKARLARGDAMSEAITLGG